MKRYALDSYESTVVELLSNFAANDVRTSSRKEQRRQTTGGRDVRTETDDDYDDRLGNGRRTGDDNHGADKRGRVGVGR